jgi:GTPase
MSNTKRNMVISLIGRPNVGKSSLFNSILKNQHKALTHDKPGVTRDRHYGVATFNDLANEDEVDFILVDTGGFYPQKIEDQKGSKEERNANHFFNIMTDHARLAIEESDLVLFVVDAREGVLPFDESIVSAIRSKKKEFWLLVNKFDTEKQAGSEAEFYSLGVNELFTVSAAHGRGMYTLRERLHQKALDFYGQEGSFKPGLQKGVTPREEVVGRLALIGAPNAGKSTLLNHLLGAKRALVSDVAGTTVDPIEGYFDLYFGSEALELENNADFSRDNKIFIEKYEEFRKNNAEVYDRMQRAYVEEMPDELDEEMYYDQEQDDLINQEMAEQVFSDSTLEEEDELQEIAAEGVEQENQEEKQQESEQEIDEGSFWRSIHIVDTAGIRRKSNIEGYVESQSVYRSLRCITESDIVLYLIDAVKGISHQDCRLLSVALEKGKSVIVLLNKVDLLKEKLQTDKERRDWVADLRHEIPWLDHCSLIPLSAKFNKGTNRLKKELIKTILVRHQAVPTGELNRTLFELVERNPISLKKTGGTRLKVKYSSMVKNSPPTFLLFSNKSKGIPENYKRYLKNGLRARFPLYNTPIHLVFRSGSDLSKRMKRVSPELPN